MSKNVESDMEEALREVLGTMFFTEVLAESECPVTDGSVAMRVEFRGESDGEMRLRMPAETANSLAAGFLGKETAGEVSSTEAMQVAGELSNMVCGCFLSRHEAEKLFELSSPEPVPPDAPAPVPSTAHSFQLDTGCIHLTLARRPEAHL